jgi:plastocyanin
MVGMTGLRRLAWASLALPIVAMLAWAAAPAYADARTVVIQDGANGPELVPASLTVAPGDTVSFLNNSSYPLGYDVAVTFQGKTEYAESIQFGSSSTGHWTAPATGGVRTVTATQPVTGAAAKGTITVATQSAQPAPPPPSSAAPAPSSPKPAPKPAATSAKPAPKPARSTAPKPAATPIPIPSFSLGPLPTGPAVAPAPGTNPLVASSPHPLAPATPKIVAGPLEQPTGRGHGLPAALAAVLVGGTGAAYVRVLLTEAVDEGTGTVGGRE